MKDILSEIIANKRFEVDLQKQAISIEQLQEGISEVPTSRSMKQALASSASGIIAEFKRRSPSKGWIKEEACPEEIVPSYAVAGASALSILTDEKFAEKAQSFMLWKNTDGKYFTPAEYEELVKANQTDKHNTLIFLYVDDPVAKLSALEAAKAKGYDVLEMNGPLDNHYINWYESKHKEQRFVRVDSDIVDKLIQKEDALKMSLSESQQEILRPVFEAQMPHDEKIHYNIAFEPMAAVEAPVIITQNEFMRRMKEMAAMSGGGMSQFYGQMPDNFTLVVNGNHPIVIDILQNVEKEYGDKLKSITKKIDAAVQEEKRFEETIDKKKEEELTAEEKTQREELSKKVVTLRDERSERLRQIGSTNSLVRQIIDLALLTNGMLKGKNLTEFIQRSISLIEK